MNSRTVKIGYGVIVFLMFCPLIPAVIAGIIASICGAKLDEGSVHSCIVFGTDIGQALYAMTMMGYFAMGTFPLGIIALVVFSVIVGLSRRAARQD